MQLDSSISYFIALVNVFGVSVLLVMWLGWAGMALAVPIGALLLETEERIASGDVLPRAQHHCNRALFCALLACHALSSWR